MDVVTVIVIGVAAFAGGALVSVAIEMVRGRIREAGDPATDPDTVEITRLIRRMEHIENRAGRLDRRMEHMKREVRSEIEAIKSRAETATERYVTNELNELRVEMEALRGSTPDEGSRKDRTQAKRGQTGESEDDEH